MSCTKAQGFLEAHAIDIDGDVLDAKKHRRGPDDALRLAHAADRIIVAKGKKVITFDMKKDAPDDETLVAHLIGPTGNLRAPTLRKGKTLLVGFGEDAYQQVFGTA